MLVLPLLCATIGAVLPFTPLASALGFTPIPFAFFLILLGFIVAYLVLAEAVKARFYAHEARLSQDPPAERDPHRRHHRHVHRRAARFHRARGAAPENYGAPSG